MSKTYIATIIAIALPIMHTLGLDLNATDLSTTLSTIAQIGAWGMVFIGRWKAGGIKWNGKRSNNQ